MAKKLQIQHKIFSKQRKLIYPVWASNCLFICWSQLSQPSQPFQLSQLSQPPTPFPNYIQCFMEFTGEWVLSATLIIFLKINTKKNKTIKVSLKLNSYGDAYHNKEMLTINLWYWLTPRILDQYVVPWHLARIWLSCKILL